MGVKNYIATPDFKPPTPRSVTSMLFDKASERIWRGRSIRSWEWIFWVPLMLILGFNVYGFSSYYIEYILFGLSWAFIQIVPIFVIPSWINIAHAATGKLDESLRTVPVTPSGILQPRINAVLISAARIFIPSAITVLLFSYKVHQSAEFNSGDILLGAIQILGWIFFLSSWGFAAASIIARRGGNFFLWYFAPGVILILIVIPLLIGQVFSIDSAMLLAEDGVFGTLYGIIGYVGLATSPFIYAFACMKWGERTG